MIIVLTAARSASDWAASAMASGHKLSTIAAFANNKAGRGKSRHNTRPCPAIDQNIDQNIASAPETASLRWALESVSAATPPYD